MGHMYSAGLSSGWDFLGERTRRKRLPNSDTVVHIYGLFLTHDHRLVETKRRGIIYKEPYRGLEFLEGYEASAVPPGDEERKLRQYQVEESVAEGVRIALRAPPC